MALYRGSPKLPIWRDRCKVVRGSRGAKRCKSVIELFEVVGLGRGRLKRSSTLVPGIAVPRIVGADKGAIESAGTGLMERKLCPALVDVILSFLDTPSIVKLTRVSKSVRRQALIHIRVITSEDMHYVPDDVPPSCFGRIMDLLAPWLTQRRNAVPLVINQLLVFPNLEVFGPEHRNFRCEDAKAFAQAVGMGAGRRLKILNLSHNIVKREGGCAIASCLHHMKELEVLLLRNNAIYFEAAGALCSALSRGACPKLRVLGLAFNWIGVLGSRAIGLALGSGALKALKTLDLRGNGITSVGLCFLVEALTEAVAASHAPDDPVAAASAVAGERMRMYVRRHGPPHPQEGDDQQNQGEGVQHEEEEDEAQRRERCGIMQHLTPLPELEELLLSYNYIGRDGALALAEAVNLGLFPKLRRLCLAHNALDDVVEWCLETVDTSAQAKEARVRTHIGDMSIESEGRAMTASTKHVTISGGEAYSPTKTAY